MNGRSTRCVNKNSKREAVYQHVGGKPFSSCPHRLLPHHQPSAPKTASHLPAVENTPPEPGSAHRLPVRTDLLLPEKYFPASSSPAHPAASGGRFRTACLRAAAERRPGWGWGRSAGRGPRPQGAGRCCKSGFAAVGCWSPNQTG
jgi:hypothetical protein